MFNDCEYIYIEINLFATLKKFSPQNAGRFGIPRGTTIRELVKILGIPLETAKLVFINGVKAAPDSELYGEERVAVFPPIGGG